MVGLGASAHENLRKPLHFKMAHSDRVAPARPHLAVAGSHVMLVRLSSCSHLVRSSSGAFVMHKDSGLQPLSRGTARQPPTKVPLVWPTRGQLDSQIELNSTKSSDYKSRPTPGPANLSATCPVGLHLGSSRANWRLMSFAILFVVTALRARETGHQYLAPGCPWPVLGLSTVRFVVSSVRIGLVARHRGRRQSQAPN